MKTSKACGPRECRHLYVVHRRKVLPEARPLAAYVKVLYAFFFLPVILTIVVNSFSFWYAVNPNSLLKCVISLPLNQKINVSFL